MLYLWVMKNIMLPLFMKWEGNCSAEWLLGYNRNRQVNVIYNDKFPVSSNFSLGLSEILIAISFHSLQLLLWLFFFSFYFICLGECGGREFKNVLLLLVPVCGIQYLNVVKGLFYKLSSALVTPEFCVIRLNVCICVSCQNTKEILETESS